MTANTLILTGYVLWKQNIGQFRIWTNSVQMRTEMKTMTTLMTYASKTGRIMNEINKTNICSACHLAYCSEPSHKGSESNYPDDEIYEAGLDQKHENFLHTPKRPTLSEMCTHCLVVIPRVGGHLS